METKMNPRKVAVIGCGFVGSATAFALMQSKLFSEMVLLDVDFDKADGEAMDIAHGVPFAGQMKIYAGNYEDIADAAIIIVTAGANQKPDETRLDLVNKNVAVYKNIIPQIVKQGFEGILLVVSNPVDILTYAAVKLSGFAENRVIGSGTVLDTARLKCALSEHLGVDSRNLHSFIIGEHGDAQAMREIAEEVKNSAYEIIEKKDATYYGIAMSVKRICESIVRDEKSILPVSAIMHGNYGIEGIALSMPAIVGANGVETHVPIALSDEEIESLHHSAETIKGIVSEINL